MALYRGIKRNLYFLCKTCPFQTFPFFAPRQNLGEFFRIKKIFEIDYP